jgi:hypothetical protein
MSNPMFTRSRLISESTTTPTTSSSLRVRLDKLLELMNSTGKMLSMETLNELTDELRTLEEFEKTLIKKVDVIKKYITVMNADRTSVISFEHMQEYRSIVSGPTVTRITITTPYGSFPATVTEHSTPL